MAPGSGDAGAAVSRGVCALIATENIEEKATVVANELFT